MAPRQPALAGRIRRPARLPVGGEIGIPAAELRVFKEAKWRRLLESALTEAGKNYSDIAGNAKGAGWKIGLARRVRQQAGAPHRWIAHELSMGCPSSVRVYLSRGN